MNELADERGWSDSTARSLIHGGMLVELRSQPAEPSERPIPSIPAWAADRVAELNRERADAMRASGCRVIGDPTTLVAPPETGEPEPPPDQISLALAAASVAGVVDAAAAAERRARAARRSSAHARIRRRPRPRSTPSVRRIWCASCEGGCGRGCAEAADPDPFDGATSTSPMSHQG